MTYEERFRRFPPFLVIALSKVAKRPKSGADRTGIWRQRVNGEDIPADHVRQYRRVTRDEVVARSGLSSKTVQRMTSAESWEGFSHATIVAFTKGCRIDMGSDRQLTSLLAWVLAQPQPFGYLSLDQRRLVMRLLDNYRLTLEAA